MGIALSKKYSVQPEEAPTMIQAFNDEDNKIEDDRLGTPPENIVTFFNDKVEVIKDPETKGWKAARSQKNKVLKSLRMFTTSRGTKEPIPPNLTKRSSTTDAKLEMAKRIQQAKRKSLHVKRKNSFKNKSPKSKINIKQKSNRKNAW
mmetsp:Transcript_22840/g.26865  ORF Transcript_22840/g.26865 Transcript_22840/m.26865 type:complete len:147 (+) Transcript_22840:135-575(+)